MKAFQTGQQVDVPGLVIIDYTTDDQYLYVGEALPGSDEVDNAWQIKRVEFDSSGREVAVTWANGGTRINQWSQRTVLPYS